MDTKFGDIIQIKRLSQIGYEELIEDYDTGIVIKIGGMDAFHYINLKIKDTQRKYFYNISPPHTCDRLLKTESGNRVSYDSSAFFPKKLKANMLLAYDNIIIWEIKGNIYIEDNVYSDSVFLKLVNVYKNKI